MVTHCQNEVPESKNRSIGPNRLIIIVLLSMLVGVVAAGFNPVHAELDLADTPMLALVHSPPANIMVVLDDSGSMTYEILIAGRTNGEYPSPDDTTGATGFCYIFDYLGDNAYDDNYRYMREQYRTYFHFFGPAFLAVTSQKGVKLVCIFSRNLSGQETLYLLDVGVRMDQFVAY